MSEEVFSRSLIAGAGEHKIMTEVLPHRPSQLLDTLCELDFRMAVTVPDGWLGQLLVQIENHVDMQLIRATHEEEALAAKEQIEAAQCEESGEHSALDLPHVQKQE